MEKKPHSLKKVLLLGSGGLR
ncbi:MAG: hypothetical protein K0Q57_1056, partial [Gammaproteobacteria bacterium]|nr:hypothetical protein [Gammaproteobacteria bacterium]